MLTVAVLVVLNLWVQFKFFILDDLQIQLDPIQTVVPYNEGNITLNFDVGVGSFQFCHAACNMTLIDAYSKNTLDYSENIFLPNVHSKKVYSFDPHINGAGQKMYYLKVSCHNLKSLLCKTDEKVRTRSALITVNHNYTKSEYQKMIEIRDKLESLKSELINQSSYEDAVNRAVLTINSTIPISREISNFTYSQIYLLDMAKSFYFNQNFLRAQEIIDKIYIPNMFGEWLAIKNQVLSFNQNVIDLKFLLNDSFDEVYHFYQKTNPQKATLLKTIYLGFDAKKMGSFEKILAFSGLNQVKSNVLNLTRNYTLEKAAFENEINHNMTLVYSLLGGQGRLGKEICVNEEKVNDLINSHNQNLLSYNPSFLEYINFVNDSLPLIFGNGTHFISPQASLLNQSGMNLLGILSYIKIDRFTYCENFSTLYPNALKASVIFLNHSLSQPVFEEVPIPSSKCCIYGECSGCSERPYPVIFLHGHAVNKDNPPESSINVFSPIQNKLSDQKVIVNGGDINYDSASGDKLWSKMPIPLGVRATYYYVSYYDANILSKTIMKEEGIESYSIRLKEIIDLVLNETGSDKVIIIAHSMGGLVVRKYLMLFGESKVDRIMLIATPNHGITGKIEKFCGYLGDKKACSDMAENSVFLKKLSYYQPKLPVGVISGVGCDTNGKDGDGVVQADSAKLNYAKLYYVTGSCNDLLGTSFHNQLLLPDKYPGVYNTVKDFILDSNFLSK